MTAGLGIGLCLVFPREKRENEEFDDEEFLARKTDEKNEELSGLKLRFFFLFLGEVHLVLG